MGGRAHGPDERRTGIPSGLYVAVATASAVTVLAAFSFAVSSVVDRLEPDTSPADVTASTVPASENSSLAEDPGATRASGAAVPFRIDVVLSASRFAVARVRAPKGRPLELRVTGVPDEEAVLFDSVDTTSTVSSGTRVVVTPPLDPGVYPFSTASGLQSGVLVVE